MTVICPHCDMFTEIPQSSVSQHDLECEYCGKKFFAAGDLTFRYGELLEPMPSLGLLRVACPYCHQHYRMAYAPFNNMIGCQNCLKIFVLPSNTNFNDLQPAEELSAESASQKNTFFPESETARPDKWISASAPVQVMEPAKPGSLPVYPWSETVPEQQSPVVRIKHPDGREKN